MATMQQIIHLDMDSFYASVELARNPQWRNLPVVIGRKVGHTGIVTTANYIAREYGINSAMPMFKAEQLCKNLVVIPPDMQTYKEVSKIIAEVLTSFSDSVEFIALDEAYIDISAKKLSFIQAVNLMQSMRKAIFLRTNLHCSAGLASNRILAKVASEYNKPNGEFYIAPEDEQKFIDKLELKKINGVGKKLAAQLRAKNIYTCKDLRTADLSELSLTPNKFLQKIIDFANGKPYEVKHRQPSRKSISHEQTFLQAITSLEECLRNLKIMFIQLNIRHAKLNYPKIIAIFIKVKYANLTHIVRERKIEQLDNHAIANEFLDICTSIWNDAPVKLLGVGYKLANNQENIEELNDR